MGSKPNSRKMRSKPAPKGSLAKAAASAMSALAGERAAAVDLPQELPVDVGGTTGELSKGAGEVAQSSIVADGASVVAKPPRVLFLHQNFPGQFGRVAHAINAIPGAEVLALTRQDNVRPQPVKTLNYPFGWKEGAFGHRYAEHYAKRTGRGFAAAEFMKRLADGGFNPDVVVGHGGWGETLFVKDVWPETKVIVHAEFSYSGTNSDVDFDPEFPPPANILAFRARVRSRNAAMLQALIDADLGVAPTQFQADSFPEILRSKIKVIHEGIDTQIVRPNPGASVMLQRKSEDKPLTLKAGDEVLTFVNSNLEPYRGYHIFMRALPEILRERPDAHVVLVGGDKVSYGPDAPGGRSWKDIFLEEVGPRLDMSRVHFAGRVPYPVFLQLMQVSRLHVYLTYPFVLSWSMLEAMSVGNVVLGSATGPVEEVIDDGRNGLLFPFFSPDDLARRAVEVLENPHGFDAIRKAARDTVLERYDLRTRCLPQWLELCGVEQAEG